MQSRLKKRCADVPCSSANVGDRVGAPMPPDRKEEVRRHFGDTVKAAAEFSYVSLGIGMVLGVTARVHFRFPSLASGLSPSVSGAVH